MFELQAPESLLDANEQQTLFYPSDLELGETVKQILQAVESASPALIVLDSLSEIRLLAQGSLRYRRQLLALKHFFARRGTTVLLLDDLTSDPWKRTGPCLGRAGCCRTANPDGLRGYYKGFALVGPQRS